MAGDDGFADPYDPGPEIFGPDALQAHASTFQNQVKLGGEQFGIRESRRAPKLREPVALRPLEGFDDRPRRMFLLRQLDRGVRVGTAAVAATNHGLRLAPLQSMALY